MKRTLFILVAIIMGYTATFAKQPQEPTSYNYQRGKELINNEEYEEGISVLQKELADNPKNGYAYMWLSFAYLHRDEIGNTLHAASDALKYLPKNAKADRAYVYTRMGTAYGYYLTDTVQALHCFNEAIRLAPENTKYYDFRGRYYAYLHNYDMAAADFQKASEKEPYSVEWLYMLGQTYMFAGRYTDALSVFEKADKLESDYQTLAARADAEIHLGKYEDAAKHIVASLEKSPMNHESLNLFENLPPALRQYLLTELRVKQRLAPNDPNWVYCEMYVISDNHDYEGILRAADKLEGIVPQQYTESFRAGAYEQLGDFERALRSINLAIEADSTDYGYLEARAEIYDRMDSTAQMFHDLNMIIEKEPTNAGYYNDRGQAYLFSGQYQKAIEDYDMAIALAPQPYLNYMRGRCYWEMGDTLAARMDFEKAAKGNDGYTCFALHFMGQDSLATHLMDSILVADSLAHEETYNAACLCALQGKTEDAFRLLTQDLESNHAQYAYARRDIDFRAIHGERFDSLLAVYEARVHERISRMDSPSQDAVQTERVVEVPFSASNGVTTVKCSINGLPLTFVFDTGASNVSISQTEASFMYKNGYLSKKDIVGNSAYITADGSISIGTNIILQKIDFGGLELKAVRASVVGNQRAPLLLGQSVLQRLGKIEIDNQRQVLKITTKK